MFRIHHKPMFIFVLLSIVSLGCEQDDFDSVTEFDSPTGKKIPLAFDESSLLPPAIDLKKMAVAGLQTQTYYDFFPAQIGYADYDHMVTEQTSWPAGTWNILMKDRYFSSSPYNFWLERTYSSRFQSYPELVWVPDGDLLASGDIGDNERIEMHWVFETPEVPGYDVPYAVKVEWEVSSEANYDFLYINSTGDECGDSGVIQLKESGVKSGFLEFDIPSGCVGPNSLAWVGIYYIKDYSISRYDDNVKISKVTVGAKIPVGVR